MAMAYEYYLALLAFSAMFNWLLAYLVFYLRYRGEHAPMTLSQRWGLSILAWLFIGNALLIMLHIPLNSPGLMSPDTAFFVSRIVIDLEFVTSVLLLCFGIVYPRLIISWRRLMGVLGFTTAICMVLFVIKSLSFSQLFGLSTDIAGNLNALFYMFGCFIPIFLWLPEYERQNSPQMRMTLTILVWGYLFVNAACRPAIAYTLLMNRAIDYYSFIVTILVIIVYILLIRALYFRLGRWSTAEWTHVIMMSSLAIAMIVWITLVKRELPSPFLAGMAPWQVVLGFLMFSAGWMMVRPILFSYGLLRYQMFGPEVRAEEQVVMIMGLLLSGGIFIMVFLLASSLDVVARAFLSLLVAGVAFLPLRSASRGIVERLLPMSGGADTVPLKEKRITYLMGLQTAVFEGDVDDEQDLQALEELRRSLRISDREHDLLMHGFARERPPSLEQGVEEVYLFNRSGDLLASSSRGAHGARKEMVASMFNAVKDFSQDALRQGSGFLGAIEYGDKTLIIEVENEMAIGVILRGKDNPQVRQRMRDVLRDVDKVQKAKEKGIKTVGAMELLLNEFLKG